MTSISKSEKSYIQSGILAGTRTDGRQLDEFRPVSLQTSIAPLANGSARLKLGNTEIIASVKLEVSAGPPQVNVACSDEDYTDILSSIFSSSSLLPTNLSILPNKKAWLAHLDILILADQGNVVDAMVMAAHAALFDTKVPRTRPIEYKGESLDTRSRAVDFELVDYWDEGDPLEGQWPICVTLNLLQGTHFLDATPAEESSAPLRVCLFFSFIPHPVVQGIRVLGSSDVSLTTPLIKSLLTHGENHAKAMHTSLLSKLGS